MNGRGVSVDNTRKAIGFSRLIAIAALFLISGVAVSQTGVRVTGTFSGLVYDRATQTFNSVLTLANHGQTLNDPLSVTISTGSVAVAVTGANAAGANTFVLTVPLANGSMPAGAMQTVVIAFSDPSRTSFTPSVISITAGAAVTTIATKILLDPSDSTAISNRVVQVISTADAEPIGNPLLVPSAATGTDALILAVDSNYEILMAAVANSSTTTLSAKSTALALTRFLVGAPASTATAGQLNAAIESTPGFPNLVSFITTAFDTGTAIAASPDILNSLNVVTAEIQPTLLANSQATPRRVPMALAPDTVTTKSLPYTLLSWSGSAYQSIFLTRDDGAGNVEIQNTMSIEWSVVSTDTDGNVLCMGDTCVFKLPPLGTLASIAGGVLGPTIGELLGVLTPVDVTGTLPAFNITVQQNDQTHADNVNKGLSDLVSTVLPFAPACTKVVVGAIISPSQINALAGGQSTALQSYFSTLTLKGFKAVVSGALENCLTDTTDSKTSQAWAALWAELKFLNAIATTLRVVNAANLLLEWRLMYIYWNNTQADPIGPIGVCESSSFAIANCAKTFQGKPPSILMAPAAVTTPTIIALDESSQQTALPSDLHFKSENPAVVAVDPVTGALTAELIINDPPVTIEITDPAEQAKGSYTVSVIVPQITIFGNGYPQSNPPSTSIAAGGGVLLQLTDRNGNSVILPPGVTWRSSNPARLAQAGVQSAAGSTLWKSPDDATPGDVTVTASGPGGFQYGTATVTITCSDLACKLPCKWLDSFGYPWSVNADDLTGTFEILALEPSPCFNVPLPVTIQVTGSNSFVATAILPSGGNLTCQNNWVDTLTIDPSGLIARGTFATGINHGPETWTRASGPVVIVPNVVGFSQGYATSLFPRASLHVGTVTMQASATVPSGTIISTSPAVFSSIASGSAVNLIVAMRPN
jgi:hypothetical protein